MINSVNYYIILLLLPQLFCSGSSRRRTEKEAHGIITTQKDITTPITTVPNIVPTIPTSSSPILNPNSNPDTVSPASTLPFTTITNTTNNNNSNNNNNNSSLGGEVGYSGVSWCIASPSASLTALQVALDYACGYGGADCSEIQPSGRCYNPTSVRDHASFAFNSYYHKNPLPNSCNFGGSAVITSTNPSSGTCQYPSISTSSSVLNTTNSIGANVFGSVPVPMTPSSSGAPPTTTTSLSNTFLLFYVFLWILPFLQNTYLYNI